MTTTDSKIGYVYKIACLNPEITDCYVGSCQAFRTRKNSHKSYCVNISSKHHNINVYQFIRANGGWTNWNMVVIEEVSYSVKHQLLLRERFHLEALRATLNKTIPSRTHQEYRETNKQQINERNKQYYEENKEQINEYQKQYQEENKARISEKAKQSITCECGKSLTKSSISGHKKSIFHKQYILNLTQESPQIIPTEVSSTIITIP